MLPSFETQHYYKVVYRNTKNNESVLFLYILDQIKDMYVKNYYRKKFLTEHYYLKMRR